MAPDLAEEVSQECKSLGEAMTELKQREAEAEEERITQAATVLRYNTVRYITHMAPKQVGLSEEQVRRGGGSSIRGEREP